MNFEDFKIITFWNKFHSKFRWNNFKYLTKSTLICRKNRKNCFIVVEFSRKAKKTFRQELSIQFSLNFPLIFSRYWLFGCCVNAAWIWFFLCNPIQSCWCLGKTEHRRFSSNIEALRVTSKCGSANQVFFFFSPSISLFKLRPTFVSVCLMDFSAVYKLLISVREKLPTICGLRVQQFKDFYTGLREWWKKWTICACIVWTNVDARKKRFFLHNLHLSFGAVFLPPAVNGLE